MRHLGLGALVAGVLGGALWAQSELPVLIPEPQVSTGQFTTATEVRPILDATRANWVAVREYGGQDLIYVTHLLSWRCGLLYLRYSVNDAPWQVWALPPCHENTASPNALLAEDGAPYVALPVNSVNSLRVEIIYDDLGVDSAAFDRSAILIP